MRQAVLVGVSLAGGACAHAPSHSVPGRGQTIAAISAADLRTRVAAFAHDSMAGRAIHTAGHRRATDYLAREAARLGLAPAGENGGFFQNVPLRLRMLDRSSTLNVGDEELTPWVDFFPLDRRGRTRSVDGAESIYGGALLDSATWISADAAEGRVVVLTGSVRNFPLERLFGEPGGRFRKARGLMITGLDSLLAQFGSQLEQPAVVPPTAPEVPASGPDEPTVVLATTRTAAALLGGAVQGMTPGKLGKPLRGAVRFSNVSADSRNVIAILPGTDPSLRGQYLALGAHSDHEGTRRVPPGADADSVFNGADDDASGSMALLEIAEALVRGNQRPRRSVLFVWHTAEERGMFGSRYFTEHSTVARDSIVAQINLDMIGRGTAADAPGGSGGNLQVLGARRLSSELGEIVEAANRERARPLTLDYTLDAPGHPENLYCRSDHAMYARFGIPVLFLTTGLHSDYHKVSDEAERLDYTKLAAVTGYVADLVTRLGNLEHRLRTDQTGPVDPNRPCRQ